jgi:hypothetical protein
MQEVFSWDGGMAQAVEHLPSKHKALRVQTQALPKKQKRKSS